MPIHYIPSVALDALKKITFVQFLRGLENSRFPVLVFGPESVSYERSRLENRTILREISARAFFGIFKKSQMSKNPNLGENIQFQNFREESQKKIK